MYRDYGRVYKVFITFDKNKMNEPELEKLINENFDKDEIVKLDGYELELLWEVPENEGSHEIEIDLYYILGDDEYGTYKYEYVR